MLKRRILTMTYHSETSQNFLRSMGKLVAGLIVAGYLFAALTVTVVVITKSHDAHRAAAFDQCETERRLAANKWSRMYGRPPRHLPQCAQMESNNV